MERMTGTSKKEQPRLLLSEVVLPRKLLQFLLPQKSRVVPQERELPRLLESLLRNQPVNPPPLPHLRLLRRFSNSPHLRRQPLLLLRERSL